MKKNNGKLNTNCVKSWTGDIKLQQKCTIFLFDPLCLGGLGFYRTSYAQLMHVYRNLWAPALQYEQTHNHTSTNLKLQLTWNWEYENTKCVRYTRTYVHLQYSIEGRKKDEVMHVKFLFLSMNLLNNNKQATNTLSTQNTFTVQLTVEFIK